MTTKSFGRLTSSSMLIPAIKAWEMYLTDQGRSLHTVKAFISDVNLLTAYLAPDKSIGAINTADLNRFFRWMVEERKTPCSPKTLSRRITSVKSFFRWLTKYGAISADPAEKVAQRPATSPTPRILTEEEERAVIKAAASWRRLPEPDARPYALVALLLQTGIKKSECLGVRMNHITQSRDDGSYLFVRYASPSNRYKERKLNLDNDWLEAFSEYRGQYHPNDKLFPWSPRRLEYLLEDIGKKAGLKKHLSFDMCRWTCAVREYEAGIDPDTVRQHMGVSKIQWREILLKLRRISPNI